MTSNHHTPIPSSPKQAANAATINNPLSELDEAITNHENRIETLESEFPPASGNPTEYLNGDGGWTVPAGTGASVDGHVIKDEGIALPQRATIDFVGAGVTVTNEAGGTQVSIPGGGHIIQDEGVDLANQPRLNFVGAGVTVTNDGGGNKTVVTIPNDHGGLSGLGDDDHIQYHNDLRGDARYPRKYAGKTAAPTVNDDSGDGYAVGDRWLDETNDKEYVALDVTLGAAVWTETTMTGGADLANGEGVIKNGKIVRTVASNNITVAIKTLAGSDPSALDPVKVVINGAERSITSALSVTINAGTSTFKAGSAQHANQILYLTVHLGWRASDSSVFIGVARAFGRSYADFSSTATNDDYLAYSGSAPASTDKIVNIGAVTAANSGSASYNWSIPATDEVINYPIAETPWMIWNPGWGGFSSVPSSDFARYKITRDSVRFMAISLANGTSNSTSFTLELPFRAKTVTDGIWYGLCGCINNSTTLTDPSRMYALTGGTQAAIVLSFSSSAWTASGGKRILTMPIMEYQI